MAKLSAYSASNLRALRQGLQTELERASTLEGAAQRCVELLYRELEESVVLARVYATLRYKQLPASEQEFAKKLAEAKGVAAKLNEGTITLTLLGTRGSKDDWNDRRRSEGHAAIPLVGSGFVETAPMIARLMREMGLGLDWIDKNDTDVVVKTLGSLAGVFYVRQAKTERDHKGRLVIPAQDFVASHQVETVFGVGGSYPNGAFVTIILFTRELIEKPQVESLMTLVNTFKTATMGPTMQGKIFS